MKKFLLFAAAFILVSVLAQQATAQRCDLTMNDPPELLPGTITGTQTICSGFAPAQLNNVTAASGGTGTLTYQWEFREDDEVGGWTAWSPVLSGGDQEDYQPGALILTTQFRRAVDDANGCGPVYSNEVTVTVFGYSGGDGTAGNPFQIANLDDLKFLSDYDCHWDKHFVQTDDIDASTSNTWNSGLGFGPIGQYSVELDKIFTGSYNGQGHTITGLTINWPNPPQYYGLGMFGITFDALLERIALLDVDIYTESIESFAGGLVGLADGNTAISHTYVTGEVKGGADVGGMVGILSRSIIIESFATCEVTGTGSYIGGLVGKGTANEAGDAAIYQSYATGSVSGGSHVGGLVGKTHDANIYDSYATGSVSGTSPVGGLVGESNPASVVLHSFWDKETSGQTTSTGGTGKTTAEMKTKSTFEDAGWSFNPIWTIAECPDWSYPYLVNNTQDPLPGLETTTNPSNGGTIATTQTTVCYGDVSIEFTSTAAATGHIGILEYQWQISTDSPTFVDISSAVSETYTHIGTMIQTTWFRRLARVTCDPVEWENAISSNVVKVSVVNNEITTTVDLTVLLQGPFNNGTGLMNTTLNDHGLLPATQPYNTEPWNYTGDETLPVPLPEEVVDWVLVEVRSDEETPVARKAGLLLNDGSVSVQMHVAAGEYHLVVYHRNHAPVMSEALVYIPNEGNPYDLTDINNVYMAGAIPLGSSRNGELYGMVGGDANGDGTIKYSGPGNDRVEIIIQMIDENTDIFTPVQNGYWFADVNMDNWLRYTLGNNDRGLIISNIHQMTGLPWLTSVYHSVVPGFAAKTDHSQNINNGPVNIRLKEQTDGIAVTLNTTEPIQNSFMDNLQFTLAWYAGDNETEQMLTFYSSGLMLEAQGEPVNINGINYQTFATTAINFLPEFWYQEDLTALWFGTKDSAELIKRLWIAENSVTSHNNTMYYVSIGGINHTGIISDTELSTGDIAQTGSIRVFPNPVREKQLNIEFYGNENQLLTWSIFNMQGKLVAGAKFETPGQQSKVINLDRFEPGMYILHITGNDLFFKEKIVIMK